MTPRLLSNPIQAEARSRDEIQNGRIRIEPYDESAIGPASIDLTLDDKVRVFNTDQAITRADIDFTCLGSCDYITGQAFSFVSNLDAIGAWPPKRDSHVEMDGATPEQAGVPAELLDAAADGCQVLFDGMIYEDGKLFVRDS